MNLFSPDTQGTEQLRWVQVRDMARKPPSSMPGQVELTADKSADGAWFEAVYSPGDNDGVLSGRSCPRGSGYEKGDEQRNYFREGEASKQNPQLA